jgi:addiction module HigA family antidote
MITLKGIDPQMIANNLEPSEPIHPGELLKEEIEYRGISQKKLAESTGISYTVLNEVLNCKRDITVEYALLFEAALGIEAGMWIRIQTDCNMQTVRQNKTFAARLAKVRSVAAMF